MKELIEIQAELKAPKNQHNSFGKYNYRSCEDILEAVKPLLKKQKCTLTLTDGVLEVAEFAFVDATATISNGKESVSVRAQAGINPNRKGMDIAQSFGSSSSYARKYALNGLFLIDDTKDADHTNDHGKASKVQPRPIASMDTVKFKAPTPQKETMNATHPNWDKCVKYLRGVGSMTELEKKYIISDDVKEKLIAQTLG